MILIKVIIYIMKAEEIQRILIKDKQRFPSAAYSRVLSAAKIRFTLSCDCIAAEADDTL